MNSPYIESKAKNSNDAFAVFYFILLGCASSCSFSPVFNYLVNFPFQFSQDDPLTIFRIPSYLAQILTMFTITKLSSIFSYNARMLTALLGITCITVFIPIEATFFQGTFFGVCLTMVLLFIWGFTNSLCFASLAGLASQIEGKYTSYFLIGNSLSSLVTFVIIQFVEGANFLVHLAFTVPILLVSVRVQMRFMKSEFYLNRFSTTISTQVNQITNTEEESMLSHPLPEFSEETRDFKTLLSGLEKAKLYVFLLAVAFTQFLLVEASFTQQKFIPNLADNINLVTISTISNIFYIIGKKMGQYRKYYNNNIVIFVIALRFALIVFLSVQARTEELAMLNTIWFGYLNVVLFGLTLGFLQVALFILAPEQVTADKKEIAGFVSMFGMNIGIIMGRVLGF